MWIDSLHLIVVRFSDLSPETCFLEARIHLFKHICSCFLMMLEWLLCSEHFIISTSVTESIPDEKSPSSFFHPSYPMGGKNCNWSQPWETFAPIGQLTKDSSSKNAPDWFCLGSPRMQQGGFSRLVLEMVDFSFSPHHQQKYYREVREFCACM